MVGRDSVEPATVRLGCVKYLNARPLIRGWPGEVVFDHPSALCRSLAQGDLDIALVSSFEFLRHPIYRIVDGISISSDGPVYSVVLACVGDISQVEEVELDPAAETSVNLLRCLFAEFGLSVRFVQNSNSKLTLERARLLIGDQAIHFRRQHANQFEFWDLGEQWQKLFDLPFVYALWLVRPEVENAQGIADQLRSIRNHNLARIAELVADCDDREFCDRYYREHLRFHFGAREKEGFRKFQNSCEHYGLIRKRPFSLDLL